MSVSYDFIPAFSSYVHKVMEHYEAAGMAVALIEKDRPAKELFFGYRDVQQLLPIDRDTIFGLASVSKSFTALAVLQLAQQGKVDLDAPVSRYIPQFENLHRQPVLVRHLMSHAGSFWPVKRKVVQPLAEEMGLWDSGEDLAYSEALSIEANRRVCADLDAQAEPLGKPGQYLSYSNDSFGLLSDIIRTQGGEKNYADYMVRHVLKPLGMNRSFCDFLRPAQDQNAAILYEKRDGEMIATRDYHDSAFVMNGGGAMKSTLADMETYLGLYLSGGAPLIGEKWMTKMLSPYVSYRYDEDYGFGLSIGQVGGQKVCGHGGSLTGVSSAISFCPEKEVAVVVLCNTTGVPATAVAKCAMQGLLGLDPAPVEPVFGESWSDGRFEAVCGEYISPEGSALSLQMDETGRKLLSSGKEKEFFYLDERTLLIRSGLTWSDVTFFEEKGRVFAARYGGRMLKKG
ncbi:MAG: beta-lactamase family protein [Oscillospiraceae bacterium]|nr:beta-lactamase family protein [Oscillospiraceae bacterium]